MTKTTAKTTEDDSKKKSKAKPVQTPAIPTHKKKQTKRTPKRDVIIKKVLEMAISGNTKKKRATAAKNIIKAL